MGTFPTWASVWSRRHDHLAFTYSACHQTCTHVLQLQWRAILKRHKIATRAINVTKAHFPSSGFGATGLTPFNLQAVKSNKAVPSLANRQLLAITTACTFDFRNTPTHQLCGYFQEILKPTDDQGKPQKCRRIALVKFWQGMKYVLEEAGRCKEGSWKKDNGAHATASAAERHDDPDDVCYE